MATDRPNFIDLRSQSQASVSRPLRSPRLHVAGEAPPELSPLDAIALQSRLLAKQLEDSSKAGRRMSRLPPLTTSSPLIVQGRSDYFRSLSQDSGSDYDESQQTTPFAGLGLRTEVEDPAERPVSMHPRMSRIPPTPDDSIPVPPLPPQSEARLGRRLPNNTEEDGSYFGARREQSPSPLESADSHPEKAREPSPMRQDSRLAIPSSPLTSSYAIALSPERSAKKNSFDSTGGLVPPRSLFPKRSSSVMSSPLEPTDEDGLSSMSTSFYSQGPRKLSSSSGFASPAMYPYQRSPSMSSDMSAPLPLPRPAFNFSRPLSRAGDPALDTPARQTSSDSHASFILGDDSANTPISMIGEGLPDGFTDDSRSAAPSYIYSKFSLPRGKILQRSGPPEDQPQASFRWEQPAALPSNVQTLPLGGQAPPSPPTRPTSSASSFPRPSFERPKISTDGLGPTAQLSPNPSRPSTDGDRSSDDVPRGRPLISPVHDAAARAKTPMSVTTSDTASTLKAARTINSFVSAADIPAEEHVEKAIALHEKGSLNESTYHLRHAAKQGHPTGMLLFALACRHGWGMRANPREGAEWLRKAAECASLEIADDEAQIKEGKRVNSAERKTRKAQFALSIYELGVSHMNGWGIEQDKSLALRCFEIAGCTYTVVFPFSC